MPNVGKLYIDVNLLARQLNFPPDHGIVGMGYDPQNGGYLIVGGPSLPPSQGPDVPMVTLETSFFGSGFGVPGAPPAGPTPPFQV